MSKMKNAGLAGIAAAFALASSPASAISTIGHCELTDVTSDIYGAADACYGLVKGNIAESGSKSYETMLADWAPFAGGDWSVAAISFDAAAHTWSGDLSGYDEVIIVLKQSTLWGAWYFNPAAAFGTWSTAWDYPNGNDSQGGGLSHGFALVRGQITVPEPGTLALLGLGLLGLGLAGRRRRKN